MWQERTYVPGLLNKIKSYQINIGWCGDLLRHSQVPLHSGWRLSSIARYGLCAALLGLYISEWKVVTRNLPFYNIKYSKNVDYDYLLEQDKAAEEAAEEARKKAAEKAARQ